MLDSVRGLAALGVVLFHSTVLGAPQLLPHGYLAVDVFFVLSGFVISHAYTPRVETLGVKKFLWQRCVRLLPLSIFGTLLGTLYFLARYLVRPGSHYGLGEIGVATLLNLVLLPKPWVTPTPTDTIFPTNTPLWSLSLELAVNALWAARLYRLRTRTMLSVTSLAGAALALSVVGHGTANLGATWDSYAGGVLRALFGFSVGVLLWRHPPGARGSDWVALAPVGLTLALMSAPVASGWFDAIAVLVAGPLITWLGIAFNSRMRAGVLLYFGRISYALYIVHIPIMMFAAGIAQALHIHADITVSVVAVSVSILVAQVLHDRFDVPARAAFDALFSVDASAVSTADNGGGV